jgi:hypothetical protein
VQVYAGSNFPEKPRSLDWEGKHYIVDVILDQRREPNGLGFTVGCLPGRAIFDLFFEFESEHWTIQPKGSIITTDEPHQVIF